MTQETTTSNTDVVRTAIEAFDDRDFNRMAAVHAPDVVVHDNGETLRGYDAVEEHMASALRALGDPSFSVEEVIADGGTVAARYRITGVTGGDPVELTSLSMARVVDGAIAEVWVLTG